ncbi:hypothetical protein FQR65_LT13618 [Abscondita terminalis]|nr:hypothetical protein FQR65_LT13618 [Abscondita terminalis]
MRLIFGLLSLFFSLQCCWGDNKRHADVCIETNNLDGNEIFKIHNGDNFPTDNNQYLIFIECYWKRIGYLTRNGELNFPTIWQTYFESYKKRYNFEDSKKKLEQLIAKCEHVSGNSPALKAINMNVCITS